MKKETQGESVTGEGQMERERTSRERKRKTPYQRIMLAAKKGRGVRLSYEECFDLTMDDAITTRGTMDDLNDQGIRDSETQR